MTKEFSFKVKITKSELNIIVESLRRFKKQSDSVPVIKDRVNDLFEDFKKIKSDVKKIEENKLKKREVTYDAPIHTEETIKEQTCKICE